MSENVALQKIAPLIHEIRGERVILDSDLAKIYGVSTTRLNEQVKRNVDRFPADFAFRLKREEMASLMSQIAISSSHGGRRYLPRAFTEHGAIMSEAEIRGRKTEVSDKELHAGWLCHADARQVFDLPGRPSAFSGLRPEDRVADPLKKDSRAGKSETYRASEWQSPVNSRDR